MARERAKTDLEVVEQRVKQQSHVVGAQNPQLSEQRKRQRQTEPDPSHRRNPAVPAAKVHSVKIQKKIQQKNSAIIDSFRTADLSLTQYLFCIVTQLGAEKRNTAFPKNAIQYLSFLASTSGSRADAIRIIYAIKII